MKKSDADKGMAWADLALALGLLSRLPVPTVGRDMLRSVWAWPLVGLPVTLIGWAVATLAAALGLTFGIAATLGLVAMLVSTGALHEDGLADCADGFWGGHEPARRLEIMKDSTIGSYGMLALTLALLLRWQAMMVLMGHGQLLAGLGCAALLSRVAMVGVMGLVQPARKGGLSAGIGQPSRPMLGMAACGGMAAALLFAGFAALPAALVAVAAGALVSWIARAKIGGQTGDVLGATQQIAEICVLLLLVALLT